jgi:hypothetical protein
MRAGLRHAVNNPHLTSTLIRAAAFFFFCASSYWALLPLIARSQAQGGPELYGLLLGMIGTRAGGGAFLLPLFKTKLDPDRLAAAGTAGTALALLLFATARAPLTAFAASVIAGPGPRQAKPSVPKHWWSGRVAARRCV